MTRSVVLALLALLLVVGQASAGGAGVLWVESRRVGKARRRADTRSGT
jgi:hypothetical protein